MSKPKPGALFMQAWVSELSAVARRPSWLARKLSTQPPRPSAAPPAVVSANDYGDGAKEGEQPPAAGSAAPSVSPPPASIPQPPPPAAVDVSASIALAQLADENAGLRTQITEMAARMARLEREILEASEQELVKLAVAIAERVVGRELEIDPALPVAWAREAIEVLAAKDGVVIAVAKDVRDEVPSDAWSALGTEHHLIIDPQLARGGVEVRAPEGTLAAGAAARLGAVAQAVGAVDP